MACIMRHLDYSTISTRPAKPWQQLSPGFDSEKVTFDDLVDLIRADCVQKGNRTSDRVEDALQRLRPVLE
jgi:hypothetical protein